MTTTRLRVLFVGEGSTLAHAVRPMALAGALDKDRFDVSLAAPERYRRWAPDHVKWLTLRAQEPEVFAERLRSGRPVFSLPRLQGYVADDLELMRTVNPQVVVGDLRLSLAASARRAGVAYISLSNAYWNPGMPFPRVRPALDGFRGWPAPLAEAAFRLLLPMALRWHARPVDQLLAGHGLDGIGGDLQRAFTEADVTLFADLPGLFPGLVQTDRRRFLGPVAWEPPTPPPSWWPLVPEDRPVAYLTLGSSGDASTLERLSGWLLALGFTVLVATAARSGLQGQEGRVFVADYLPGGLACARADLVVCNGGSPTATQALLAGRPVLGVAANMDQFLNMAAVEARGAGLTLRADRLTRRDFERAMARLTEPGYAEAAAALQAEGARLDPVTVLENTIGKLAGAA